MRVVSCCGVINILHGHSCHLSMSGVLMHSDSFPSCHLTCAFLRMKLVRQGRSDTVVYCLIRLVSTTGLPITLGKTTESTSCA